MRQRDSKMNLNGGDLYGIINNCRNIRHVLVLFSMYTLGGTSVCFLPLLSIHSDQCYNMFMQNMMNRNRSSSTTTPKCSSDNPSAYSVVSRIHACTCTYRGLGALGFPSPAQVSLPKLAGSIIILCLTFPL